MQGLVKGTHRIVAVDHITPFRRPPIPLTRLGAQGLPPQRHRICTKQIPMRVRQQMPLSFLDHQQICLASPGNGEKGALAQIATAAKSTPTTLRPIATRLDTTSIYPPPALTSSRPLVSARTGSFYLLLNESSIR